MKVLNQKVVRWPKCFSFFLFSSSSDRLVQNCVTLSQWFSHKTAAFYTKQCTIPSLFHNFEVPQSGRTCQWRTMASFAMPLSSLVRMRTNHLAMKQFLFRIVELDIRLCAWRQGESLVSIVDSVFEESLVHDSSSNTVYIYWGILWGQTCWSVIDGDLQLKHAPASNKVT